MRNILLNRGWGILEKGGCSSNSAKTVTYSHLDIPDTTIIVKGCNARNETFDIKRGGITLCIGVKVHLEQELNRL